MPDHISGKIKLFDQDITMWLSRKTAAIYKIITQKGNFPIIIKGFCNKIVIESVKLTISDDHI